MSFSFRSPSASLTCVSLPVRARGRSLLTVYQSRALAAPLMNYSLGERRTRDGRHREADFEGSGLGVVHELQVEQRR